MSALYTVEYVRLLPAFIFKMVAVTMLDIIIIIIIIIIINNKGDTPQIEAAIRNNR